MDANNADANKIKNIKLILNIAALTSVLILSTISISGVKAYRKVKADEPTSQVIEKLDDAQLQEYMTVDFGKLSEEKQIEVEVMIEEELERRHSLENQAMIDALIERRLAEVEVQKQEEREMDEFIAMSEAIRVLPKQTSLSERALTLAMTQLGKPYVWGAQGPDAFDCSGLVLWAYNNEGYFNMPRTTREQWTQGALIRQDQTQRGDLIYFLNNPAKSPVDHVGIYLGNGEMLHAPRPGRYVEIKEVPWERMVSIRRHEE